MPAFSRASLERLATCHPDLQRLFREVVKHFDCTVICGHRDKAGQDKALAEGTTTLPWPKGKHNRLPSRAADVAPYPIDWKDRARFTLFAGFVLGTATQMGISLRWGGDWNRNTQVKDETGLSDLPHFELAEDDSAPSGLAG